MAGIEARTGHVWAWIALVTLASEAQPGLAELDAVAVGIGNPGRAHAVRDSFDRVELDPARGGRP